MSSDTSYLIQYFSNTYERFTFRTFRKQKWHSRCFRVDPYTMSHREVRKMLKLTLVKLEKRIAPRYVPF
jgi:hypothetical protein